MRIARAALLVMLALAPLPAAAAVEEPTGYAVAQRGSFKLVANVLLSERGGEMKGVWLDAKRGCAARRSLRVVVSIDLVDAQSRTTRVKKTRTGQVQNCAEGGPNFGFDLSPRTMKLGCQSGRWKPGRYSLTTRVVDVASGLAVQASLYRQVTRPC